MKRGSKEHITLISISKSCKQSTRNVETLLQERLVELKVTRKGWEKLIELGAPPAYGVSFDSAAHQVLKCLQLFGHIKYRFYTSQHITDLLATNELVTSLPLKITEKGTSCLQNLEAGHRWHAIVLVRAMLYPQDSEYLTFTLHAIELSLITEKSQVIPWPYPFTNFIVTETGEKYLQEAIPKLVTKVNVTECMIPYLKLEQLPEYLTHERAYIREAAKKRYDILKGKQCQQCVEWKSMMVNRKQ